MSTIWPRSLPRADDRQAGPSRIQFRRYPISLGEIADIVRSYLPDAKISFQMSMERRRRTPPTSLITAACSPSSPSSTPRSGSACCRSSTTPVAILGCPRSSNPFEDARAGLRANPPTSLAAVRVLTVAEQEFQAGGSLRLGLGGDTPAAAPFRRWHMFIAQEVERDECLSRKRFPASLLGQRLDVGDAP